MGLVVIILMTGEISDKDIFIINEQIRQLDTATFNHYKGMTEHFIAAVLEQKSTNT